MARLIHLMIRVRDLRRAIDCYRDAFGFQETHRLGLPPFTLVYLRSDASPVETMRTSRDTLTRRHHFRRQA